MPLPAGERLGPYEILAPIGEGGMGEVYKARDTRLERVVALKVSKAEFTERFEREARAVAALNHPNICHLHDVGPNYLVMEFIDGEPLKGPLPLLKAVDYAGQILDALDAAHRKGITHRDLKPANIMVTKQGIKLLDFGLAKQHLSAVAPSDATVKAALTAKGEIAGTLQYMAPEQLHGKDADARSDLFAFGCVLYEMLSGKRAFDGESAASVIVSILEREPARLEVQPALERVITRCLAKDPDDRFQNALDLKTTLKWALESRSVEAPTTTKKRWPIVVSAVLLGGIAGAGVTSILRKPAVNDRVLHVQIAPSESSEMVPSSGFALSPDGRMVTYAATANGTANGKVSLWVRMLDSTTPRLLEGTENARNPFWSPDSKSIAYTDGLKLWRIDVAGGPPRGVCDSFVFSGSWTADGRILFVRAGSGLFQVPASGGVPSEVTIMDRERGETGHLLPQALPDGRFLFRIRADKPENAGTFLASFSRPNDRMRVSADYATYFAIDRGGAGQMLSRRGDSIVAQQYDLPTFKPSGEPRLIVVNAGRASALGFLISVANGLLLYTESAVESQFLWLDPDGKRLGTVGDPQDYMTFRLSPDALRIASTLRRSASSDLWMLETERGASSRLTFTGAASINMYPTFSPDGSSIVYRGASQNLYRKNANGAGADEQITQGGRSQFPTDWSGDGRLLLYYENDPQTQRDLWILPVAPDGRPTGKPQPYLNTRFNEYFGAFSPELSPRWVLYQSDESGREEIYVQAFPEPRGKFQVSTKGGRYARWGARGQKIFFVSPENKLMSADVKLGVDAITVSTPVELFALPSGRSPVGHPFDVTADGKRFLVPALTGNSTQALSLIVNWETLLNRPVQ